MPHFRLPLAAALCAALAAPGSAQDPEKSIPKPADPAFELLKAEHDKNKDGRITKEEYSRGTERFERLDADRDGVLTAADFGGSNARDARGAGPRRGRTREAAPGVGEAAPDFTLDTKDGKAKFTLSAFAAKRPVALIFGSYT